MNEELQKQLAALLQSLMAFGTDAKRFAAEQIPPLVAEKIAFGRVVETIYLVMFIALTVAMVWLLRKSAIKLNSYGNDGWVAGIIAGAIVGIFGLLGTFFQVEAVAMAWFAPRLYIVEWLKSMVVKS